VHDRRHGISRAAGSPHGRKHFLFIAVSRSRSPQRLFRRRDAGRHHAPAVVLPFAEGCVLRQPRRQAGPSHRAPSQREPEIRGRDGYDYEKSRASAA
jgi:hypothetical protein